MLTDDRTSERIRVLHVINCLTIGGAETSLFNLLTRIDKHRFQSLVVSLIEGGIVGDNLRSSGTGVVYLNMTNGQSIVSALIQLFRIIRRFNPHLIQGWMYHGSLMASLASLLCGNRIPVIWNIRHAPANLKAENSRTTAAIRVGALLSRQSSSIVYNSKQSMHCHNALGYPTRRQTLIPNGFDLERFTPSPELRRAVRSELVIHDDALVIGMVSNFRPPKDHANFFEAAAILLKTRKDIVFVLAGERISPNNVSLQRMVHRHGLNGYTRLLGERHDVPRLLAAIDVATLSSSTEAFPNVVGEAMACGTPCVVTDVGDCATLVGQTGLVVPAKNPGLLAEAWDKLLSLDYLARKQMGMDARRRTKALFSLPTMVAAYQKLYEDLHNTNSYNT